MAKKLYEEQDVRQIADAIREKNGESTAYKLADMAEAIRAIPVRIPLGEELADTGNVTPNMYISGESEITYNGWSVTDYIPVQMGYYMINVPNNGSIQGAYSAFYDSSKKVISRITGTIGLCSFLYIPDGISYVRFSAADSAINTFTFRRVMDDGFILDMTGRTTE